MKIIPAIPALALFLAGCAVTRPASTTPTVTAVQTAVESAQACTRKATGNVARAQAALQDASRAAERVAAAAPPGQRANVVVLRTALNTTQDALDSTEVELSAATAALEDSGSRLDQLQQRVNAIGAELSRTQAARSAAENREAFWRAAAWKLGILSVALSVWTFRRPLLALVRIA